MGDQLRPVNLPVNPIRVSRRGEGQGRNQRDQHQEENSGQAVPQKKKRNSPQVNLATPLEKGQVLSEFDKLLKGEH